MNPMHGSTLMCLAACAAWLGCSEGRVRTEDANALVPGAQATAEESSRDPQGPSVDAGTQDFIGIPTAIGGTPFPEIPAIGAITYFGQPFCSGTLIAPRRVLTAAHCVDMESLEGVAYAVGPDVEAVQASVAASGKEIHPGYDGVHADHDIGLLLLAEDAPADPLPLIDPTAEVEVGETLRFVGYGADEVQTRAGYGVKRAVDMDISAVGDHTVVAGGDGRNACYGDSGGPALRRDASGRYAIAAVSARTSDAQCADFTVAVRVDVHAAFTAQTAAGCGDATSLGTCDGETVRWCEGARMHHAACDESRTQCGWDAEQGFYACIDPRISCRGETTTGRCEGTAAIFCTDDEVVTVDCEARGAACGFDEEAAWFACTQPYDPCEGVSWSGQCSGDTLEFCDDDRVITVECPEYGLVCGTSDFGTQECIVDWADDGRFP